MIEKKFFAEEFKYVTLKASEIETMILETRTHSNYGKNVHAN